VSGLAATVLLGLTLAGWCFWLAAWVLAERFFARRPAYEPLVPAPPVSVLKPLRGLDAEALANFESYCRQEYPADYQLLFGVGDPDDPAVGPVRELQARHPERDIQLHVLPEDSGNPKAMLLHQLAARARYDVLVASDSDIRVPPEFLGSAVAPLADPRVGLVTFPYRGTAPVTFTARLEALHMTGTFLPSVLVGRRVLGGRFALGASLAVRRRDLERVGGFEAVVPYLADDYQLGLRIARLGLRVHLARTVVASVLGPTSFHDQWEREVRWARSTRVSRPFEYPGLLLTHTLPLAAAYVPLAGATPTAFGVLAFSLVLRLAVAWRVTALAGAAEVLRWRAWLPVRDLLSAAVWLVGAVGTDVSWRGRHYRVRHDGRMQPIERSSRASPSERAGPAEPLQPRGRPQQEPGQDAERRRGAGRNSV